MSPLPARERAAEYAWKGLHLALRGTGLAPEFRAARRLRGEPGAAREAGHRKVLVLTPRDWAAHVQWEATIAQALRLRGAEVTFVECGGGLEICDRANTWEAPPMPCRSCSRYVHDAIEAHGFASERLATQRDWSDEHWPELDELHLAELRAAEYAGLPLGRLVEVPVKWFLMRAALDDEPLAAMTYRRFLRSARRIAGAFEAIVQKDRPDVVVLCNGLFLFESIAFAVARRMGIDVVTYERGLIKETLVFRRNAPACLLDMSPYWEDWAGTPLTGDEERELDDYLEERRHGRRTIDQFWKDPRFSSPERTAKGRMVAMFPNLTWDSAVIGQGRAFEDLRSWLLASVELFSHRPTDELVIRVHPAESKLPGKWTREPVEQCLRASWPALPPNVRVIGADDPLSSYSLMEECDAVLVFSSTTGLEAAVHGKPVVVAGNTHYRGKGFTQDVSTSEEFAGAVHAVLDDPDSAKPDVEAARRYAHLFFFKVPVRSPGVEEHVLGLARITVRDRSELRPGRSDDLDRVCDGILGAGDFGPLRH